MAAVAICYIGYAALSGTTELAFTLVGSEIYVFAGGYGEVTARVYRCDLAKQPPNGSYHWIEGPKLNTHKHNPLVFNLAGDIYVLSIGFGGECNCDPFEVLKKDKNEWVSLEAPPRLTSGGPKFCSGSCVFEDDVNKKIILLVAEEVSDLTLWIYDAKLGKWEEPEDVDYPDYTFPVNDLDLLTGNNSFVINGGLTMLKKFYSNLWV